MGDGGSGRLVVVPVSDRERARMIAPLIANERSVVDNLLEQVREIRANIFGIENSMIDGSRVRQVGGSAPAVNVELNQLMRNQWEKALTRLRSQLVRYERRLERAERVLRDARERALEELGLR